MYLKAFQAVQKECCPLLRYTCVTFCWKTSLKRGVLLALLIELRCEVAFCLT